MRTVAFCSIVILLCGCKDQATEPSVTKIDSGEYSGTFTFTEAGKTTTTAIKFTFEGSKYKYQPEDIFNPPPGYGGYSLKNHAIVLNDSVGGRVAIYDVTLVLCGTFVFTESANAFVFAQQDVERNRTRKIELIKKQ